MGAHIETGEKHLLGELRKKLGAMKHLSKQFPTNCRKTLATGIILSKIIYMIQIWGGATAHYLNKIQTIMNNNSRFVLKLGRRTSTRKLMQEMGWLDVRELSLYHSLVIMCNITRRKIPYQIAEKMLINDDWTLQTHPARLLTTKNCFRVRTTEDWNKLDPEIRTTQSLPR